MTGDVEVMMMHRRRTAKTTNLEYHVHKSMWTTATIIESLRLVTCAMRYDLVINC